MKRKKKYQLKVWPAPSGNVSTDWHNCDGEIGKYLRQAVNPPQSFNDGNPTWYITVVVYAGSKEIPISHCPICGEKLPQVERQPLAYGGQS
jgi:hypothetical protein